MILTKDQALYFLKDAEKKSSENARWIAHCVCVGNTAERIAKALGIDKDKACAMGYVHDIGKAYGSIAEHSKYTVAGIAVVEEAWSSYTSSSTGALGS